MINPSNLDKQLLSGLETNGVPKSLIGSALPFNYNDIETPQPDKISLTSAGSGAFYGTGLFGSAAWGQGDLPITRKTVEGSGFAVALKLTDTTSNLPWAIKGFEMEFTPGGRR